MTCNVGIAERAERLVVVLLATGLSGLGVPYIQAVGLWLLAVATAGHGRSSGCSTCAGRSPLDGRGRDPR